MDMTQRTNKKMWIASAELVYALATGLPLAFIMSFLQYTFVFPLSSPGESAGYDSLSGGETQSSFLGNLNTYWLSPVGLEVIFS